MWAVLSVVINTYALLFLHIFIKTHHIISLFKKTYTFIQLITFFFLLLFLCSIIRHVCHIEFSFFNIFFFSPEAILKKTANRLCVSLTVSSSRMVL